jgi:hypothetical protein
VNLIGALFGFVLVSVSCLQQGAFRRHLDDQLARNSLPQTCISCRREERASAGAIAAEDEFGAIAETGSVSINSLGGKARMLWCCLRWMQSACAACTPFKAQHAEEIMRYSALCSDACSPELHRRMWSPPEYARRCIPLTTAHALLRGPCISENVCIAPSAHKKCGLSLRPFVRWCKSL